MSFVLFVVRLDFLIEHGNLGAPVRKICASLANFELLQCKVRKIGMGFVAGLKPALLVLRCVKKVVWQ